jgi:hypothetical protein
MSEHKTLSPSQPNDALCATVTAEAEPLKPPEYKRNERGQFDRPGKTLAKTAKKTGLINNPQLSKRGGARPGAGRPLGAKGKATIQLREAILAALDKVGGENYLARLAIENSSAFSSLLARVLPHTLAPASESDGGGAMVFHRVIVWPDGRREVEGVTPKALPAPATPDPSGT